MKTFPLYYKIKIIFILEMCSNWNCQWKKFREDYFLYKIRKTKCFKDKELKGIFPALVVFFRKWRFFSIGRDRAISIKIQKSDIGKYPLIKLQSEFKK